jgi:hypothetical protein
MHACPPPPLPKNVVVCLQDDGKRFVNITTVSVSNDTCAWEDSHLYHHGCAYSQYQMWERVVTNDTSVNSTGVDCVEENPYSKGSCFGNVLEKTAGGLRVDNIQVTVFDDDNAAVSITKQGMYMYVVCSTLPLYLWLLLLLLLLLCCCRDTPCSLFIRMPTHKRFREM